jgi:5-methyltetrahydropteroyltriglutamate--homocysteine methyltransferase
VTGDMNTVRTQVSWSPSPRRIPRAEMVGSLLRPTALRKRFEAVYEGRLTPGYSLLETDKANQIQELDVLADDAIRDAVARQMSIGLDVLTDGEMRRPMFTHSVVDALAGYEDNPHRIGYTNEGMEAMAPPTDPLIGAERLRKIGNPALHELEFLQTLTDWPVKLTFPSGSYWYYEPAVLKPGVYESQDDLVRHVIELEREILAEVVRAGARYIQLDWPLYPALVDRRRAADHAAAFGETVDSLLAKALAADHAVIEGLPADVTTALHICRGNYRSRWLMQGSLEPIAERIFNTLPYDRFFIEWEDTRREGDYKPLRFVPRGGPIVVMGIVSTKLPEIESTDDMEHRLDEAARFLDIEQLAISPQCGFASTWEGNEIAEEIQWRKLEVVAEVADRVWDRG